LVAFWIWATVFDCRQCFIALLSPVGQPNLVATRRVASTTQSRERAQPFFSYYLLYFKLPFLKGLKRKSNKDGSADGHCLVEEA
jgi:hypothetical protein